MQNRDFAYAPQSSGYMADNIYAQQQQPYMSGGANGTQDPFTMERLRVLYNKIKNEEQRALYEQDLTHMEELATLRHQLNSQQQRAPLAQDRQLMEDLKILLNQRQYETQRAPLRGVPTERIDTGLYDTPRMPPLGRRQTEQRGRGYLDDEYTDARYASRGAAYDHRDAYRG